MNYYDKRAKYWGQKIKKHYKSHKIKIKITGWQIIPMLQRYIYIIKPAKGTQVDMIFSRAKDIQISLGLKFFYPYKDGTAIRIAVSEHDIREKNLLKILRNPLFSENNMNIPIALGYNLMGSIHIEDLEKLLHLLIVGPSGTGKSVALQCIILSIIVKCPATSVRLLIFDIGGNSLTLFGNVKHLYHDIVKDIETSIAVLESLVDEMDHRYTIDENEWQHLPYIVCIMDEFDDIISCINNKKESNRFITAMNSLLRRGRKAKIIMILASHDPTLKNTKINTNGIISRIAFQCLKHQNSSTALGVSGADKLSSEGAMLFKSQKGIIKLQGSFVTPAEIEKILSCAPAGYDDIDKLKIRKSETVQEIFHSNAVMEKDNQELADIAIWTLGRKNISDHQIQKNFHMGNRAAEIVEILFEMGIVGPKFAKQPRSVLPLSFENLSNETSAFLERCGYTKERIENIFASKSPT